jgi:protoporphyrinogen oxidase
MDTSELSYRVIPNRSKKIDFASTLKHLLFKKYLDLAKREPGELDLQERESLPTYYPKDGFGEIANRIAKKIKKKNGEVLTNQKVIEVQINDKKNFKIKTKDTDFESDYLISTIPINKMINLIEPKPDKSILDSLNNLKYLSLILVYISTKKVNVLDCEYCYFVNRTYNRLSEMNFIRGNTDGKKDNLIIAEISCHHNDETWKLSNDEIFALCTKDLKKDKFLNRDEILNFEIIKIESVYPIYRKDYKKHLENSNQYFSDTKNIFSSGRQGQFYYGDSDQMIRSGFDTADKIINKENKD